MDATQMICDSILESDEDEENADARAEAGPLATLRVFKNKHIPERVLPLYLGENVLGRDPSSCTLPLHAQSVSKQHTAVSISVFPASSRRICASVEALVWDMGSMNGTRKGRLKLTPHVRYALSDGDNLMLADIPCQYSSCVDPGSLVNTGSGVAIESQVTREDVEVHTNGHAEEPTRASFGERGEIMETPARTKVLSFEQTPDHPEGSLVPQSDSDSDEERGGKDRWRKTLVSGSDSPVASPTFLSPTNKIIPESEDESPITPSLSSKHHPARCVSTDNDEQDFGAWQQRLKNQKAAKFNAIDGKEEEGEVSPEGTEPEKSEGCAPESLVNSVSTWAESGLDQPGPAPPSELIQVLNMDSDTDVEGEEESSVSVGPGSPNRTQPAPTPPTANAPSSQLGQFIMDSDTDVDDEDDGVDASRATTAGEASATESPAEVPVAQQTDSDTDVEGHDNDDNDDDDEPDGVSKATPASPQSENTAASRAGSIEPPDFHLESDTDVEEEGEGEGDDAVPKSAPAKAEAESRGVVFASAAPPNFDSGSDTDDDFLLREVNSGPSSEAAPPTPAPAADPGAHLDILSDSDTDVEEDSPLIPSVVASAVNAGPKSSPPPSSAGPVSQAAALGPDSDADTDVEEISSSPGGVDVSTKPADGRMDSDTDLEEEGGEGGTEGGPVSSSSDEKDQGHRASLQRCSTPMELSGLAVAEMETQEYLCPSIDPFKCPRVPALRPMVSLSCSDSQGEDDFVVAETQSFIVAERDQQSSPSRNYTLDETQPFIPQGTSKDEDGLSDSLHLQAKDQALAIESTQAFILPDVNLEATQDYATPPSLDRSSMELNSELEATQSYLGSAGSSGRSPGSGIKRPLDIALEATQAFIPESLGDVDAVEVNEVGTMDIASAETQLMDFPSGYTLAMAETQPMCELQEDDREEVQGEQAGAVSLGANSLSSAETQPMATSGDEDEDSVPAPRKRRARRLVEEEDTQVMTGSGPTAAGTQPVSSTSSDESEEEEDERPVLKQIRSRNQRRLHGETSMRATAAGPAPEADSDTAQQATGRPRRGRGRKPGAATSRGGREEEEKEEEEEEEQEPQPPESLRSMGSKGKASLSTRGGRGDVMPEEGRGEEEETEADQVRQGGRRTTRQPRENARGKKERLERERKEQAENERMLQEQEEQVKMEQALREEEEKQRMERDQREKEEQERLERDREERERLEVEEKERLERERKEQEEKERLKRIQREKEEQERLQHEKKEREERERLEMEEKERVERKQKAREEKERLEKEEHDKLEREKKEMEERLEKEEQERLECEKKEREERLEKEEQERIENQRKEREKKARLEQIQKEEEERSEQERKEQEERAREEQERLEKERRELEETARLEREEKELREKERLQLEEKERGRKELEEKERLKREKREQERERLRREKDERQQKAALEREEREKWRRAQEEEAGRARLETEKRAREEMDRRDERERLMREALERQLLERQQTAQAQSDQQTPRTTRGRRATRTSAAAPPEPAPETEHGPASRTRSRSNSSNSVSSERSASSATAQESGRGRGRGRGAKKTHPPSVGAGTSARESRRCRTVTGDAPAESSDPGRSTRSRSNSTDSLSSEVSACRGRGARGAGRGRGRKTSPAPETNPQPSSSGQSEVAPAPRASARGRRTKGPDATAVDGGGDGEEEPVSQPAATTRGHRRTNAAQPGAVGAEEREGTPEDSTLVARSTAGRGRGRRAQVKAEPAVAPVTVDRTDVGEDNGSGGAKGVGELESEPKEKKPAPVRRGRGSGAQVKRNPKEPPTQEMVVKEEEETIKGKVRRGRQSVAKKVKNEEVAGEGVAPAPQVVERDAGTSEVTQTPTGKSSRKRGAAPAEASPLAKSPRGSLASPGARLRAACQPYKVLFTGLVDEVGEEVVVRLGGSLALGVSDMTHLVTDKVRRTVKFLCAMARGIPVVTTQWLEQSAKAGGFLSPTAYIVKDMEQEQKFNFRLQESIRIASIQPLLQGYQIHVTKSVKPEPPHMLEIISCCGASFLAKMPSCNKEQTVVVSCEEDWPLCGPALAASLPVVSAEFLLTGILQQKADVETHALPSAPATTAPPQPARGRGRRRT
ncbi:mediator of DNA damage checkpoint protein 1 [Gadus macrocephalus]|uniref:mediator of DNA damage checkpoint protein 1 n=1 Tax=Gadus macrocephalus TaxID=80720 RepID=UPI0028CB7FD8|nr:mediator of DNA damage checkpoint protein 1 [Gadus macrocephalus]